MLRFRDRLKKKKGLDDVILILSAAVIDDEGLNVFLIVIKAPI